MEQEYVIVGPDGRLPVSKEIWNAFNSFSNSPAKPSGSVTVHFNGGCIAKVETITVKIYK